MEKYPILQSGFVSLIQRGLAKPKPTDNLMIQRLLFKDHLVSNIENFYFEDIVILYDLYRGDPNLLRDFNFREQVIKAAYMMFGSNSVYTWLRHQNQLANIGLLHARFIEETLTYIATGKERATQTVQWIKLIEISNHKESSKLNIDDWFNTYSGLYVPADIVDFIQLWVAQPKGFEDLLISLFIIFGNRPYITNVREKNR